MPFADKIISNTDIKLCFLDRLKVLLHGKVWVRLEIDCENTPGRMSSTAQTIIPPIFVKKGKGGYAEVTRNG